MHYIGKGASRNKLVVGIPTYGRSYTLFNPTATELGSPADGPGEQGEATKEKGYLSYYEICENVQKKGWKVEKPYPDAMGPYAYKGNQWVGYDDEDIVKKKARFIRDESLGGIMFWSIDNDDFRGTCHSRPFPLIEAAKEALLSGGSKQTSKHTGASRPGGSLENTLKRLTSGRKNLRNREETNSVSGTRRPSSSGGRRRSQSGKRRTNKASTTTTTTTSAPTTTPQFNPLSTPEPPTTPNPGSDFKCKDEGFFQHPKDCKKYFWCLDSGPSNLGIVAHMFTCPSGLYFNKAADSCDYSRNVLCNLKKTTTSTTTSTTTTAKPTSLYRPTTRPTTTTTTAAPEEEEEYDYSYEDEEEGDHHEEDPSAIKDLLDLIKKLGGVEELERHLKESGKSSQEATSSKSLYDRVLNRNKGNKDEGSSDSSFTSRFNSPVRNRPGSPQHAGLEVHEEIIATRKDRPQYVTISRNRPSTPQPSDDEEEEDEKEDTPVAVSKERVSHVRGRQQQGPEDEEEESKEEGRKRPVAEREYVTIRRERPTTAEPESKYVTLQRPRPTSRIDEEDFDDEEEEEEEDIAVRHEDPTEKEKKPTPVRTNVFATTSTTTTTRTTSVEPPTTRLVTSRLPTRQSLRKPTGSPIVRNRSRGTTTSEPLASSERTRTNVRRRTFKPTGPRSSTTTSTTTEASLQSPKRLANSKLPVTSSSRRRLPSRNSKLENEETKSPHFSSEHFEETLQSQHTETAAPDSDLSASREDIAGVTVAITDASPKYPVEFSSIDSTKVDIPIQRVTTTKKTNDILNFEDEYLKDDYLNNASPLVSADVIPQTIPYTPKSTITTTTTHKASTATQKFLQTTAHLVNTETISKRRPTRKPASLTSATAIYSTAAAKPRPVPQSSYRRIETYTPASKVDYDYTYPQSGEYDEEYKDYYDVVPLANKVKLHKDGSIECFDRGNFPHPTSCQKFISCARMEDSSVIGWEYTCPSRLVFDPIGGICNWSGGSGCRD